VHFVLDEAASLGHLESLDDAVDKFRGYGVRLQLYYQSLGQLKTCWPDGRDQTLLSNVSQVFFGVNDEQTAQYVSSRLGEETIVLDSGGTSTSRSTQKSPNGQSSTSYSTSHNTNWQQQARKLLKPEEVTALSADVAITFTPGIPPLWTKLLKFYREPKLGIPTGGLGQRWPRTLTFARCVSILLVAVALAICSTELANDHRSHQMDGAPSVPAVSTKVVRR
jgi:type IV secretion system protein VirD4